MIDDFLVILMTKRLPQQMRFYREVLQLDEMFVSDDAAGYGTQGRLHLVIKHDAARDRHHSTIQKGTSILTFKCRGKLIDEQQRLSETGCKIRDTLKLPAERIYYLFIEDIDGNEICLDFSDSYQ